MADLGPLRHRLFRVEDKLDRLIMETQTMSAELDRLRASVAAEGTVVQSAVTLLGQLALLIRSSVNDPASLAALADDVDAKKAALAQAVADNTATPPTP